MFSLFGQTHGKEKPRKFLNDFNKYSNIKFTLVFCEETISFLDRKVSLSEGHLITDLRVNLIDRYHSLYFTSAHINHTKRSVVFNQAFRVSRMCFYKKDFEKHGENKDTVAGMRLSKTFSSKEEKEKIKFICANRLKRQK